MPMKIMLADDHKLFADGLKFLLNTYGIKVIGVASNGFEAIQKAEELRPDVIFMDIMMPGCTGIEALRKIKAKMPEIKVVMLTTSDDDDDLFQAIELGASGYLLKNLDSERLIEVIADLKKGGAPISPNLTTKLLKEIRNKNSTGETISAKIDNDIGSILTERQIEVLAAVAKGATYKEVGQKLHITERTVKYHMSTIMEQLEMGNKSQVIAYAVKMGWTDSQK